MTCRGCGEIQSLLTAGRLEQFEKPVFHKAEPGNVVGTFRA